MSRSVSNSGVALLATVLAGCVSPVDDPSPRPQRPESLPQANFRVYCATCHGSDLAGARAPSLFNQAKLNELPDEIIRHTILEGILDAGMPPFKGILSEPEIGQLIAYMRNEAQDLAGRPVFVPSPAGQVVHSEKQSFRIELLATGLAVPWSLAFLPDGRILVTERAGRLRIIENDVLLPEPVSGTPTVQVGQDAGMFDIALHPDYSNNGWIYLSYAETVPGYVEPADAPVLDPSVRRTSYPPSMTVIIRGKLSADNEWVETQELYRAPPELYTTNGAHFGSRFAFDDDGHVFYSLGDRGEIASAQNLASPLGKIHRINADGTVPADNPFVDVEGAIATIWSYGHRNPQGLAFDPRTGLLWESEHGPSGGDEINIIEPGKNYGWGVITMGLQRGIDLQSAPGMEQPIVYYTPTIAPSGIRFYVGDRYPGWKSNLFVAGLAGQQLRRLEIDGRKVVAQEVLFDQFGRTRLAAAGPDGLLYVLLQNPTGSGTGVRFSTPTPGMVIRLIPLD